MDAFLGEVRLFGFSYAPLYWASCDGSSLPTAQFPALYSILGTKYGGNSSSFNLPNLRGRAVMGVGSSNPLAQAMGSEAIVLDEDQLPPHTHSVAGEQTPNLPDRSGTPSNMVMIGTTSVATVPNKAFSTATTPLTTMAANTIASNGSGLPHENRQPCLAVNFCISTDGMYPQYD